MVEEIISNIVFGSYIISTMVSADLVHWFQASRALVLNLYKIKVAKGVDR